ncbi:MAG: NADH-quinone oxidoreductase subunit N [Verrucomicrobiae bacterium]|nr:NADH-quinone oxidoreductase subunit N [Verrucomicrobiae bacterium]
MPAYTLEIIVVCTGLAMLLIDAFAKLEDKRSIAWLGLLGIGAAFLLLFKVEPHTAGVEPESAFWIFYADDRWALFYKGLALLATFIVLLLSAEFEEVVRRHIARPGPDAHPQAGLGEFFALPVFCCAGLMWMASATHLVGIFVALETVTISFYIMVAYLRRNAGSLEAGVKYLILGALSTGFLVYGFAWLFGATGSMELKAIAAALRSDDVNTTAALFAFALILVALAFKVGAVPFQFWIPDVYQGAPTPITAFLSVGSKAAGFIVLLRVAQPFLESPVFAEKTALVFAIMAGATLVYGNLAALPQSNFKRLLAYSSIAHAGFLLMIVAAAPKSGAPDALSPAAAVAFYLAAYLAMTLLAFIVMTVVRTRQDSEEIAAYRGLGKTSPFLAFCLLIAMASLAGIPLTAGFFGKFFAFALAIRAELWTLVVLAAVGAGAGFYYYLRIVAEIYWRDPAHEDGSGFPIGTPLKIVAILLMLAIVAFGVFPGAVLGLLAAHS